MEALLNSLSQPLAIGLIILGIVVLVGVIFLARRLRRGGGGEEPLQGIGLSGPVDYTSLPIEAEPESWRDRFTNLSLPGRVLLVVVPLLVIIGGAVLVLLLTPEEPPPPPTPTPEPATITINSAILANPQTIRVAAATTNISNGTEIKAELLNGDQIFEWYEPDSALGTVERNRVELTLRQRPDAAAPTRAMSLTVRLSSSGADGQPIAQDRPLEVPQIHAAGFYKEVAAVPTATPTRAPSATPQGPTPTAASPTPTTPPAPTGFTASVFNGGNIRQAPSIPQAPAPNNVVGQGINAGEQVTIFEKTADGRWYSIRSVRGDEGWVNATLLTVEPATATQVPIAIVATVFNGGNVRREPSVGDNVVDQINAFELVRLLERTPDGQWYKIRNIRANEGWVSRTLLSIDPVVAERVPLQGAGPAPLPAAATATSVAPTSAATSAATNPTPVGAPSVAPVGNLTAPVASSGDVRSRPEVDPNNVLDQIQSGETVVLLEKTSNGQWYKIRNIRNIEGWVNFTLLRIDPAVAARVPVAPGI